MNDQAGDPIQAAGEPIEEAADAIEDAREPTEEELRAAYEAQIKQLRVEHLVLDNVVTLANLGMRRTGLAPGTADERDPEQVRLAIESIRALLPVVEQTAPEQAGAIRDAVSQLQLAFVRIGGGPSEPAAGGGTPAAGGGTPSGGGAPPSGGGTPPGGEAPPAEESPAAPKRDEPGPAQRSGRLWVPGQ
jgi:hypothetical protein